METLMLLPVMSKLYPFGLSHICNISLEFILYIYQNINFKMVSFFKCLQIHNAWGAFNQIYVQFPALLVFLISITIILSPLDFYGIFHPWTLKGFTNINSHNILVRCRNIIDPILQMRKQEQKG